MRGCTTILQFDLRSKHQQMKETPFEFLRGHSTGGLNYGHQFALISAALRGILVGKQDTTTVPSASGIMQRSIPGARMKLVDRSRHYALLEKNQVLDDAVAQFAATVLR
jgi:hypothetical protein